MKKGLNYLKFISVLIFFGLSLFILFFNPHNLKETPLGHIKSEYSDSNSNFNDPNRVIVNIPRVQELVLSDSSNYKSAGKITEKQQGEINFLISRSSSEYGDYLDYFKEKNMSKLTIHYIILYGTLEKLKFL